MHIKNVFVCFLSIILLTAYPGSAGDASLNRWVLNITLNDTGIVEEVIQAEIQNSGTAPLDGFSIVVPASKVIIMYDQFISIPATGQVVEMQAVPGGTKIIVNFNRSVEAGKNWDGRFGFTVENWAAKQGPDYSIDIPVDAPQAIVSGKETGISPGPDADIRSQVFLPKGVEVIAVTPSPFRILFQYGHMVPTWSPDKIHIGDKISIKGSFSDVLSKIADTDEKIRSLSVSIKEAKAQGRNVSEAEAHLLNAENYNTDQALASFWKKDNTAALAFVGYANDEISRAEASLSVNVETKETPQATANNKTPGFEGLILIFVILVIFLFKRKNKF